MKAAHATRRGSVLLVFPAFALGVLGCMSEHRVGILIDNMPVETIREAISRIRGRAKVEISGGVTLERLPELARTGADYVSVGALTHSAPAADLSFELEPA